MKQTRIGTSDVHADLIQVAKLGMSTSTRNRVLVAEEDLPWTASDNSVVS